MGRSREAQREYMRNYRARKRAEREAAAATDAPDPPASATTEPAAASPPRHLPAVEKMLRDSGLDRSSEEGPLVEVIKDLAAELDAGGGARTRQQYLTALRDARRVLAAAPGVPGAGGQDDNESEPPASEEQAAPVIDPEVADFASFRRAKGSASQG